MKEKISNNKYNQCTSHCYKKACKELETEWVNLKENIKEDNSIGVIIGNYIYNFLIAILFNIWATPFKRLYAWIKKHRY